MEFFLDQQVIPFAGVLLVLCLLAFVEVLGLALLGLSVSSALNLMDTEGWPETPYINRFVVQGVPFMLILTAVLLGFGGTGVLVQGLAAAMLGHTLPALPVSAVAVLGGLLTVRGMALVLKAIKVFPEPAITLRDFVGRHAVLTSHRASHDAAGEAVFRAEDGTRHSVMVRPQDPEVQLQEGDVVVLTERLPDGFFDVRKTT